jgi:LysM repeat protein
MVSPVGNASGATGVKTAANTFDYTVKKGDTLTSIAKKYHMTVKDILKRNPQIKDPNKLYVGQKIHLSIEDIRR